MPAELDFLYDNLIESLLRLYQYVGVDFPDTASDTREDIEHVAGLLARRDILTLAASARNFSEATQTIDRMRSRSLKLQRTVEPFKYPFIEAVDGKASSISLYQAYSRILHASRMELLRDIRIISALHPQRDLYQLYLEIRKSRSSAMKVGTVIFIISEGDGRVLMKATDLIQQTVAYLDECHEVLPDTHRFYPRSIRDT